MAKKCSIENFDTKKNYIKPEMFSLDIDFRSFKESGDQKTNIRSFRMILNKEYEELSKYNDFEFNYSGQNGLMFAAYLGDPIAVKLLIKEVGMLDDFETCALEYAIQSGDQECIRLLSEYECAVLN